MWIGEFSLPLIAATSFISFFIVKSIQKIYSKMAAFELIDPATGLSGREKHLVQQSWALARKDLKASGIGLFLA